MNHDRQNLLKSLAVMLRFYGLQCQEISATRIVVSKSKDYLIRKREWVCLFDHNYLRITRILECLMTFCLVTKARSFYQCLQQIYQEDRESIGGETFEYWTKAIE
jgi:Opioid growth factor receptor (OGFr) conserved region